MRPIYAPPIYTSEEVTPQSLRRAFDQFRWREPRYQLLWQYYIGDHPHPEGADRWVTSNLCKYIVRTIKGYMVGNRPAYRHAEGDAAAEAITDLYDRQSKWELDASIIQDMSTYGRAFELVYRDPSDGLPRSVLIPPQDAFVAYTDAVDADSVFGCIRYRRQRANGTCYYELHVYTRTTEAVYASNGTEDPVFSRMGEERPHGMGRVPLIEYANNKEFTGDFEDIIPLQDAYNALLTDRQDDKDAFASSMLAVKGMILGDTEDEVRGSLGLLKDVRVLHLDEDSEAGYLTRTLDETGVQVLQDQYSKDIHKIAMVPDLSDQAFAGNASGVAMAYKLYGTDQVASEKAAQLQRGYARRCKLYDAVLRNAVVSGDYSPSYDVSQMTIQLRYNLVQDLGYTASALSTLKSAGMISARTGIETLSIVPDADAEVARIEADRRAEDERMKAVYEDYPVPTDGDVDG